jgi:hypothetical protein
MSPPPASKDVGTSAGKPLRGIDPALTGGAAVTEPPNASVDDLLAEGMIQTSAAADAEPGQSARPAMLRSGAAKPPPPSASPFADAESVIGVVVPPAQQSATPVDRGTPPAPSGGPVVIAEPAAAKTIEDLDAALASRATSVIAGDVPPAPAVAPPTSTALPSIPAAPAPAAAAPVKPPAAPPAKAPDPAPQPEKTPEKVEPRTPRRSLLQIVLGPAAAWAERLPDSTRQIMLLAACVTLVAGAVLWGVVLMRSPNAPAQIEAEPAAAAEESHKAAPKYEHAEKPAASKAAKPAAKAPAKKSGGKSASAEGHH